MSLSDDSSLCSSAASSYFPVTALFWAEPLSSSTSSSRPKIQIQIKTTSRMIPITSKMDSALVFFLRFLYLSTREYSLISFMLVTPKYMIIVTYLNVTFVMDNMGVRSEEHTSELQSRFDLVCR